LQKGNTVPDNKDEKDKQQAAQPNSTAAAQPKVEEKDVDLTADAIPVQDSGRGVNVESLKRALEPVDDEDVEYVTVVSAGGVGKKVKREDLRDLPGNELMRLKAVKTDPDEPEYHVQDIETALLANDNYIAAHGPARPVRNHVAVPELEHPAIVREAILEQIQAEEKK
jgi:hypothetical protein